MASSPSRTARWRMTALSSRWSSARAPSAAAPWRTRMAAAGPVDHEPQGAGIGRGHDDLFDDRTENPLLQLHGAVRARPDVPEPRAQGEEPFSLGRAEDLTRSVELSARRAEARAFLQLGVPAPFEFRRDEPVPRIDRMVLVDARVASYSVCSSCRTTACRWSWSRALSRSAAARLAGRPRGTAPPGGPGPPAHRPAGPRPPDRTSRLRRRPPYPGSAPRCPACPSTARGACGRSGRSAGVRPGGLDRRARVPPTRRPRPAWHWLAGSGECLGTSPT